jgi:hypothetical protein
MNLHTSKGASILGVGVPMDSQAFIKQLQRSKLNELIIFYIIGNLLECKCLKWARMTNLGIWNTSYGQKKGCESNWQFNSWPLKVENHPDFFMCRWRATYRSKTLNKDYNFALDLISIGGLHKKLWPAKSRESLLWEFQDSHLGIPGKKCHLDVSLMEKHKIYYKGEGGGFPQVQAMVSLESPSLPVVHLSTKSVPTMH